MINPSRSLQRPAGLLVLVVLSSLTACAGSPKAKRTTGVKLEYVEQREHLKAVCFNLMTAVMGICRKVQEQSMKEGFANDRAVRRVCAMWQTAVVGDCQTALDLEDPRRGMIDIWTLAYQYQALIQNQEYADATFGPAKAHVVRGVERIVALAEQAAREFFEPSAFEAAKKGVLEFVATNPPREGVTRQYYRPSFDAGSSGINLFGDFMGTRLAAEAVDRIAVETDQAAWLASWMPLLMRWQVQVLLADLADAPLVVELLAKFDDAHKAIVRLDEATQRLPKDLESTFVNVVKRFQAEQGELRQTIDKADSAVAHTRGAIADSQELVGRVEATVKQSQALMQSVEAVSTGLERVAKAWEPTVATATRLVELIAGDDKQQEREPAVSLAGQLATIERTAQQLRSTAEAANEALGEVREVLEGDRGLRSLDDAAATTLDRAFWRAVLLIVVTLGAALVYRVVSVRISR